MQPSHQARFLRVQGGRSLVSQASKGLAVHENYHRHGGEGIFVKEVRLSTGPVNGFLFYDPASEAEQRGDFHLRLEEALLRLRDREVRKWERPATIFAVHVNPLWLCVGGLGFASLGVIAHEGRVNDRALLYMLILWICGFIVWASIR